MKVEYGLVCDYGFPDMQGKNNYIGVFKNINIDKKINSEMLSPQFFVGANISSIGIGNHKLELILKSPQEIITEVGRGNVEIVAQKEGDNDLSLVMAVKPTPLNISGNWQVYLKIDEVEMLITQFKVSHI
jgi:hypothetical protein